MTTTSTTCTYICIQACVCYSADRWRPTAALKFVSLYFDDVFLTTRGTVYGLYFAARVLREKDMAATLRCLARTVAFAGLRRNVELLKSNVSPCSFALMQVKGARAQATPKIENIDLKSLTDFEISKDPNEWQYVERLLRSDKVVPIPKSFEDKSPSGWTSPKEEAKKFPYFIQRTKNYMQPVYLSISYRGTRHVTVIKKIQGNIWKCEEDIREFLKSKLTPVQYCRLATRINEMSGQIRIRGDHVSMVKYWMDQKGF